MAKRVMIIGAGAAGMAAAVEAARGGAQVTIFEKQKVPGRKIQASGNGQCNVSNANTSVEHYHGSDKNFVTNILGQFSVDDTESFFASLGLPLRVKDDGRLYPFSLQARSVVDALLDEFERLGIMLMLHRRIDSVFKQKDGTFKLITAGKEYYFCDAVILAAGGRSYSPLGGSTRAYELAQHLGHSVVSQYPSIVPLNIGYKKLHTLEGIKWDCGLTLYSGEKIIAQSVGELLFTKYGISGPATIDISGTVNRLVVQKKEMRLEIDFFPDLGPSELENFLNIYALSRPVRRLLEAVLKYRMGEVVIAKAGLSGNETVDQALISKLVSLLKHFEIDPGQPRSFDEAMVTGGGVATTEVDPSTCESRKVKDLYIAGEVLDVDGDCGGYNLQFAWASGIVAARSIVG